MDIESAASFEMIRVYCISHLSPRLIISYAMLYKVEHHSKPYSTQARTPMIPSLFHKDLFLLLSHQLRLCAVLLLLPFFSLPLLAQA